MQGNPATLGNGSCIVQSMIRLALAALVIFASPTARAETIAGQASVINADTIKIHGERIRLLDVDAPESKQTCTRPDGSEWRCGHRRH